MRLCDEVLTVFNGRTDPSTGDRVYVPTVLRGASWYGAWREERDPGGGRTVRRVVTVRIPEDVDAGGKAWAEPEAWSRAADPRGLWTLRGGDLIVRGDASGATPGAAELRAAFADCMTVRGVADNRRGSLGRHWRAEGDL